MSDLVAPEAIDHLYGQLSYSLGLFQEQHHEADRLAALKAAQGVVNALQKPQDAAYHLAYSVRRIGLPKSSNHALRNGRIDPA